MKEKLINVGILLIISLLTFTYNIDKIYARCFTPVGCGSAGCANRRGSGDGGGGGGGDGYGCPGVGRFVYCEVPLTDTEEQLNFSLDTYDTNGKFIGSAFSIMNNYQLVSGRFVGIDAYDDYQKTFYVHVTAICRQGVMVTKCKTVTQRCGSDEQNGTDFHDCSHTVCWEELECHTCSADVSECYGHASAVLADAVSKVDTTAPHQAKRQDVNDINKGLKGEKTDLQPNITVEESKEYEYIDYGRFEVSSNNRALVYRTFKMRHTYNLTSAWIDPITGKVKYEQPKVPPNKITDPNVEYITEKEKETYLEVLPDLTVKRNGMDVKIGKYFVPLNAKSTDLLRYYLVPNPERINQRKYFSAKLCKAIIAKYSNDKSTDGHWSDYIYTIDGRPLSKTENPSASVAGGCLTGLRVAFRVKNGFYNEVNGNLKGYNYYYRPIDYTKPFPNGLSSNGIWIDVYDKDKNIVTVDDLNDNNPEKEIKLSESFSTKYDTTYYTNDDYSVKNIRNYNATNRFYVDWSTMNINGTSRFISSNNGVTRENCQKFYPLGCGPSTTKEMSGICKQRKEMVCK